MSIDSELQTTIDRLLAQGTEVADDEPTPTAPHDDDAPQGGHQLTELGNARRMAAKFGSELRYVRSWRQWLVWDDTRWRRDEIGIEGVAAKAVTDDLYDDAKRLLDAARTGDPQAVALATAVAKWAKTSSTRRVIEATAALAQTESPIAACAADFDVDPWAFNVQNGTIDLRTGALRPHRQADLITMLAPVAYDPRATCPRWDAFIAWALPDADTLAWFQRFAGYCLTGSVGEQILTFLHGGGDNGKSTILGVIKYILGDYATQGSPALIMATERGSSEELGRRVRAQVKGRRLVLVQELEAGRYLNEAQVKQLTGGDVITAAKLYEDEREIMPTHKLAIASNHKPKVRGADHAIWRRIRLVPFVSRIAEKQKDKELPAKLQAEAPGILRWMVEGCLAWQRDGLRPSAAMSTAAEQYRKAEDRLAEFMDDATEPGDGVAGTALYSRYQRWCGEHGEAAWSRRALMDALAERGFEVGRPRIGGRQVRGVCAIRLRSEMPVA